MRAVPRQQTRTALAGWARRKIPTLIRHCQHLSTFGSCDMDSGVTRRLYLIHHHTRRRHRTSTSWLHDLHLTPLREDRQPGSRENLIGNKRHGNGTWRKLKYIRVWRER